MDKQSTRLRVRPPQGEQTGSGCRMGEGSVSPTGKQNGSGPHRRDSRRKPRSGPRLPPARPLGQAWGHLTHLPEAVSRRWLGSEAEGGNR